jgi:hypothetical protein
MFYLIEPEIAGGLGDHTEIDTEVRPPVVKSLEYRLEGWLGDELLESFPCFIVTSLLRKEFATQSYQVLVSRRLQSLHPRNLKNFTPKFLYPTFSG